MKTPTNLEKINLDFVKFKWHQINQIVNDENINLAATESKKLEDYIANFKDKALTSDFKKALIYARQYEIIVQLIKENLKAGKSLCYKSLKEAEELNDNFLIIFSKIYLKKFLVYENNLEGCLQLSREISKTEQLSKMKSIFYYENIIDYLDASIYKKNFNEIEIENLLNELYSNPNKKLKSYPLYAKYFEYLSPKSPACQRVYAKFNVKNLPDLCNFFVKDAAGSMNLNDLILLNEECSDALYAHKIFDKAYIYKEDQTILTKKVYSSELSQSLADFQTKEKNYENLKLKQVNQEKETKLSQQKVIIFGISIALLLFAFLSYYLFKTIKQRNIINKKLENANQDLDRLNILNQKIFTVISHDFKAPISTLKYLLNQNNDNNPYIKEVVSQLDQSNNILDSLLDWAKSELNNNFLIANFDLKFFSRIMLKEIEPQALKKEIQFKNNIEVDTLIEFPESVLKVVLRNILNNAIKYSYEKGTIEISFSNNQILVRDFGKGFDAKKLDQIFKQQVAPSLGTNYESGFGIGLYFCYEIMKKNGGRIEIYPQEKGTLIGIVLK